MQLVNIGKKQIINETIANLPVWEMGFVIHAILPNATRY